MYDAKVQIETHDLQLKLISQEFTIKGHLSQDSFQRTRHVISDIANHGHF